MRYIVGYTDTAAGRDALALGVRLARSRSAPLELVLVLSAELRPGIVPSDAGYDRYLAETAVGWLDAAIAGLPQDVRARGHVVYAESYSEGLLAASKDLRGGMIVIGASRGGLLGRLSIGSVAGALLHTAVVPVALAPEGSRHDSHAVDISRVTATIGTRAGADQLLDEAILVARARGIPLRLVSLLALDYPSDSARPDADERAAAHAEDVLSYASAHMPDDVTVTAQIGRGARIEDAARALDWDPDEVVLVGSSRLARSGHLFLGGTAARMLRELPVPMIVVPRDSIFSLESPPEGD